MSNVKDFMLPDLGEGLTEGDIVSWLVTTGDVIEVDQPVVEVETAKAVVEVPSPWAGTIVTLHAEAGATMEVGTPLVSIDVGASGANGQSQDDRGDQELGASDLVPEADDGQGTVAEPEEEGSGSVLVGYGTSAPKGRRRRGKGAKPPAASSPAASSAVAPSAPAEESADAGGGQAGPQAADGRPLAKPPVRKLARDLGVTLASVRGSGEGGVINRDDVLAAADQKTDDAGAEVTAPAERAAEATRVPMTGVRRMIAQKMRTSRTEIPEATTWVDVDATGLWELRDTLNAARAEGTPKVSPLAAIMRIVVAGLAAHPELNASLDVEADEIVRHPHVNLGFAAQTDAGLVVPVIRDAHRLSTYELAAELVRLSGAARDRSITPAEMTQGTFTISNYGSFGVDGGNPVINHPEAAILGVGQIVDRPWVVDGAVVVRKVVQLSIAFDHRLCDGGEAAGFLRFVADHVERPALLLGSL